MYYLLNCRFTLKLDTKSTVQKKAFHGPQLLQNMHSTLNQKCDNVRLVEHE